MLAALICFCWAADGLLDVKQCRLLRCQLLHRLLIHSNFLQAPLALMALMARTVPPAQLALTAPLARLALTAMLARPVRCDDRLGNPTWQTVLQQYHARSGSFQQPLRLWGTNSTLASDSYAVI